MFQQLPPLSNRLFQPRALHKSTSTTPNVNGVSVSSPSPSPAYPTRPPQVGMTPPSSPSQTRSVTSPPANNPRSNPMRAAVPIMANANSIVRSNNVINSGIRDADVCINIDKSNVTTNSNVVQPFSNSEFYELKTTAGDASVQIEKVQAMLKVSNHIIIHIICKEFNS
jgi:hypothetical protein